MLAILESCRMPAASPPNLAYDPVQLDRWVAQAQTEVPGPICKGLPPGIAGNFSDITHCGYTLGGNDLPLPVALLRQSAVDRNRAWMRRFLALSGVAIAPHGKTSMAPALFRMQMEDGAWGLTAATAQQVAFFAAIGIRRIILANQLVGAGNLRIVLDTLAACPDLTLHLLVDSIENVDALAAAMQQRDLPPLNLLLELGAKGGRTGVRGEKARLALARHVARKQPWLRLSGIEAYEGILPGADQVEREAAVLAMADEMRNLAEQCEAEALFGTPEILLTAGGTEFFDLMASRLGTWKGAASCQVVIRSGCYISHDSVAYEQAYQRILARSATARSVGHALTAAVEVWAAVQSRPEPGLAFATLGKRDISHDWDMPRPLAWWRPAAMSAPEPLPPDHRVLRLNDQHAYLEIPATSPLRIGDLIGFGISHACTTFDKWRCLVTVDDDYRVTGAIRTFF